MSDVHFLVKSKALVLNAGATSQEVERPRKAFATPVGSSQDVNNKVAQWGLDNLLPQQMIRDIERTTVLQSGIDTKARIAVGKGPMLAKVVNITKDGQEELEFINDTEISEWLEMNHAWEYSYSTIKDLFSVGNAFTQVLQNANGGIWGFRRHDPCECRFQARNEKNGSIEKVFISGDWSEFNNYTKGDVHYGVVDLLDRDYPLLDIQGRSPGVYMLSMQYALSNRQYYAPSPWYAAKQWVNIAQRIPSMKEAMFNNQMSIKYLIEVHEQFWEKRFPGFDKYAADKKHSVQRDFYDEVDKQLVGNEKAYKSIFSTSWLDADGKAVSGLKITALDDKIKDGKLLPDGATADSEILFALMLNPALVGLDIPGSGSQRTAGSGSNIREAYLVQVMMLEVERRMNSRVFNIAKKLNNWDSSYVLRYPNQILTTLNTGANTAPIS